MFGTNGRWRAAALLCTVCAAFGLLAGAAPPGGAAEAPARATAATPPPPAGGTSMASATPVYSFQSYRGTAGRAPAGALWYQLSGDGFERVLFEVSGRTRSCPVRAAVLDARGRVLGEIIVAAGETLPFAAPLPTHHQVSGTYYLRLDADPYRACAAAAYSFSLSAPFEPPPCEKRECPAYAPAPLLDPRFCNAAQYALNHATVALERERAELRRRRASVAAVRAAEARKLAARRRERKLCEY
ncbi:MAG TPA: hypothetical protein VNV37_11430 [Solirubrobacteraceae bacterium]|nr:hypothetical protein [Solirubrobacteraceae bacterium]